MSIRAHFINPALKSARPDASFEVRQESELSGGSSLKRVYDGPIL
jgi:hypothetical protein